MVHVNENGRDFTTSENFSRSKSFLLRQHSHQYCLFHLSEFEQSKTLQLLNISKCSFTFVCDAYQKRENTFVCMNGLHEQQSSEVNLACCFHFYRFLWCQKERPEKVKEKFVKSSFVTLRMAHTLLFGIVLLSSPQRSEKPPRDVLHLDGTAQEGLIWTDAFSSLVSLRSLVKRD